MGTNTTGLRRGGPGRPKGSKNRKTIEKDLLTRAAKWLDGQGYFDGLQRRIERGKSPHMESYLAQRIHGKPTDQIELSGPDRKPLKITVQVVRG